MTGTAGVDGGGVDDVLGAGSAGKGAGVDEVAGALLDFEDLLDFVGD